MKQYELITSVSVLFFSADTQRCVDSALIYNQYSVLMLYVLLAAGRARNGF